MPPGEPASEALAETIRELRLERELTQEALALDAGLTTANISRIERALANPSWTTVERIAVALDVSLRELAEAVEARA